MFNLQMIVEIQLKADSVLHSEMTLKGIVVNQVFTSVIVNTLVNSQL